MSTHKTAKENTMQKLSFEEFKKTILNDYRVVNESREASLLGRREVLTGKAKFGIFGDGKEVAQIAMARVFMAGDFRSGYYRDQTFMFATDNLTLEQWFAGLYAHADVHADPTSAGRQMGGHYATRSLNPDGSWKDLTKIKNSSADISPTGGQMPRLLGLALASKFYRNNPNLEGQEFKLFSNGGNEVAFGTIGDASTSEGMFWETINAAGVLQVPMVISVWDDGHGISVPKKYQTTKEDISEVLKGFQRDENKKGYEILKTKGWDFAHLCETYEKAAKIAREEHIPVLVHVDEMTQPQGHSTSGSHERYKSKERLQWESDFDPIKKMREWILNSAITTSEELDQIEINAKQRVRDAKNNAWKAFNAPIKEEISTLLTLLNEINNPAINELIGELKSAIDPSRREIMSVARRSLWEIKENNETKQKLSAWILENLSENSERYSSSLYSESDFAVLKANVVPIEYPTEEKMIDGREVLRENFDAILEKYPAVHIFGEDAGKIGGVNQGLEGLQKKYGEHRVFDTGIRECTIIGQAIGIAMRGLRPIAEIQYLDYLLYALQIMSDDLATVQYRTKGGQKAPVIIRTRGHRLEGIWHSGSPMGMIINAIRGIYVCVPRSMTIAAGFYNTLLTSDEPALVIEPLNSYRLKEKAPSNFGEFKLPLGIPEILKQGNDVTLVTYGSNCRIAMEAAAHLEKKNISVEVIDVQTLLPFDIHHSIVESLKKTNRIVFLDEDVPGGSTAFMMQKVLEEQGGYNYLDTEPKTITSKEHRPAYGSDGDYFSKPNAEEIEAVIKDMMKE
ncbi:MAG TPA: thiamine pyrophosphate-dependent enzyme [Bacteroidia bacterium]|nr:thiamine pyrophosphate-dependent enzyme [Bacteroidia bacterium]